MGVVVAVAVAVAVAAGSSVRPTAVGDLKVGQCRHGGGYMPQRAASADEGGGRRR